MRAVAVDECVARDELVEVVEALIVAHVGDGPAVRGEDHVRALVLEATHCGVLARRRRRIRRIDLDDPAEVVHLVLEARVSRIEARIELLPPAHGRFVREAVARVLLGGASSAEVTVEVLFAGEDRAPRGRAAGAVSERSEGGRAVGRDGRAQQLGSCGGAREGICGVVEEPAVEGRTDDGRPGGGFVVADQLDHAQAVRLEPDSAHAFEVVLELVGGEHDRLVRVLVVHEEDRRRCGRADDVGVVDVVAELARLCGGRLIRRVERRAVGEERVAPAQNRHPVEALGNGERVDRVGDGRDRREAERPGLADGNRGSRGGCGAGSAREGRGEHDGRGAGRSNPSSARRDSCASTISRK